MNYKAQQDIGKVIYAIIALFVALIMFGVVLPMSMSGLWKDQCNDYIQERDTARAQLESCYRELNSSAVFCETIINNLTEERNKCNEEKFSACEDLKKEYDSLTQEVPKFLLISMTTVTITFTFIFSFTLLLFFKFKLFDKLFGIEIKLSEEESRKISRWMKAWYVLLLIIGTLFAIFLSIIITIIFLYIFF